VWFVGWFDGLVVCWFGCWLEYERDRGKRTLEQIGLPLTAGSYRYSVDPIRSDPMMMTMTSAYLLGHTGTIRWYVEIEATAVCFPPVFQAFYGRSKYR
jgi:hypothetical protein